MRLATLLSLLLFTTGPAWAQDGALDTAFNGHGIATIDVAGSSVFAYGGGTTASGQYVVCGDVFLSGRPTTNGTDMAFARFNADGSADINLGTNGVAIIDLGGNERADDCAIDSSGRIYAVSINGEVGTRDVIVARLTASGSLDTSFDGDGWLTINGGFSEVANRIVVQPDGKVLVAGRAEDNFNRGVMLFRLNADGTLDTSFDGDGFLRTLIPSSTGFNDLYDLLVDSSGRIMAVGVASGQLLVLRYAANGALDTGFGSGGIARIDLPGGSDPGHAIGVDSQGRYLVAGYTNASNDPYVLRLLSNGTVDSAFNGGNPRVIDWASSNAFPEPRVIVQQNDEAIVAGWAQNNSNLFLSRVTTSGALDTGFGTGGTQTIATGFTFYRMGTAFVDPGNRIAIMGVGRQSNGTYAYAATRHLYSGVSTTTVDLELGSAAQGENPEVGTNGTLVFTLTNGGALTATNVTVGITLPSGLAHQSNSGGYAPDTGEWTVASLAPDASATLTLTVQRTQNGAQTVTAEVTAAAQPDFDSTHNNGNTSEDDYTSLTFDAVSSTFRYALRLDGDGDYVDLGSRNLSGSAITMEAWVNVASFPATNQIATIVGTEISTGNKAILRIGDFGVESNRVQFVLGFGGSDARLDATLLLSANTWHHVAGVYDGNSMRIYIDGQAAGSVSQAGTFNSSGDLRIGQSVDGRYLNGQVDEVRIWTSARSQAEIQGAMHSVFGSAPTGLGNYWRLDEGMGTTTADAGAQGWNGDLRGNAQWVAGSSPLGNSGAYVAGTTATTVGTSGRQVQVTLANSPAPGGGNTLGAYTYGADTRTTGETLPTGVTARSGVVWGFAERGTVSANLVFDFGGLNAVNKATARLLKRDTPTSAWVDDSGNCTYNGTANTFTCTGVTSFSEYSIGEAETALPVELVAFTGTLDG
ncbi:MAG: LamG-like jellyroll fold domain-containing protein, partial [Bacteroidota bacterium]